MFKSTPSYLVQMEVSIAVNGGLAYSYTGETGIRSESKLFSDLLAQDLPFTWQHVWPRSFSTLPNQEEDALRNYLIDFDGILV